jgi:hypothetical protein
MASEKPETTPRVLDCAGPDAGFMACPACQADEWAVVCRGVPVRPYIVALVCAACDAELPVEDGAPRAPRRDVQ